MTGGGRVELARIDEGHILLGIKKPQPLARLGLSIKCLTMSYSHMGTPTLPSALSSFTSEFDMGSGGTYSLRSSGKPVWRHRPLALKNPLPQCCNDVPRPFRRSRIPSWAANSLKVI